MDERLKERLLGACIVISIGVAFLPKLFSEPSALFRSEQTHDAHTRWNEETNMSSPHTTDLQRGQELWLMG